MNGYTPFYHESSQILNSERLKTTNEFLANYGSLSHWRNFFNLEPFPIYSITKCVLIVNVIILDHFKLSSNLFLLDQFLKPSMPIEVNVTFLMSENLFCCLCYYF